MSARKRERYLVSTGLEYERMAIQSPPLPTEVKFHEVVQQTEFVARAAATIQLHEVLEVGCEHVAGKNEAATDKLKLIEVRILSSRIETRVPELTQAVQTQHERRLRRWQIEIPLARDHEAVVVTYVHCIEPGWQRLQRRVADKTFRLTLRHLG